MRLTFNPVAGPNFSGVSQALATGNRSISDGIAAIGNTVTNLGKRREARADKARKEAEARALENFKLQGVTADAAQLAQLAQGGVPIGAADFIAERQRSLLDNDNVLAGTESTRAGTASTIENTRGARIGNDREQEILDQALKQTQFDQENAGLRNELALAAERGDNAQRVLLQRQLGERASAAGLSINDELTESNRLRALGDQTSTDISNNATSVLQGEASLEGTNIQNAGNRNRNKREADDHRRQGRIAETVANALNSAPTINAALVGIRDNKNLSSREKVEAQLQIQKVSAADPGLLDATNPLDALQLNNVDQASNQNLPGPGETARGADFVEGAVDTIVRRNSLLQARREAREINPDGGFINVSEKVKELYPNTDFTPQDINEIENTARRFGIDKGEALSLIDEAIGARGNKGIGRKAKNLFSSQRHDDRVFDPKEFDSFVSELVNNNNQGNINAREKQFERDTGRARQIDNSLREARVARERALRSNNAAEVAKYDQLIERLANESATIQTNISQVLEGRRPGEAKGFLSTIADNIRNNN